MEFSPPWLALEPHAVRLLCWKLGGLATAVIGDAVCRSCYMLDLLEMVKLASDADVVWFSPMPQPYSPQLSLQPLLLVFANLTYSLQLFLLRRVGYTRYRPV